MYQIILHLSIILLLIALIVRFSKKAREFKILPNLLILLLASWGVYYAPDALCFFTSNPTETSGVVISSTLTKYPYQLITNTIQTSGNNVFEIVIRMANGEDIVLYETRTQYLSYHKAQELMNNNLEASFLEQANNESPFKENMKYIFKYYPQSKIIASFNEA